MTMIHVRVREAQNRTRAPWCRRGTIHIFTGSVMSTSPSRASAAPPSLSAESGGDVPASIRTAAKDGQAGAVLAWLDGGWVDATFEYTFGAGYRASGMTLLMIAMTYGHAELPRRFCGAVQMSRCRRATVAPC